MTAKPSTKENSVEKLDELHYIVSVREPPVHGRSNKQLIEVLSKYFKQKSTTSLLFQE